MNASTIKSRDKRRYTDTIRQAHLGVREAQYEVGLMYANGIGTAQNLSLAIEWVAKAANKGLAAAQYLLASRYALGIAVERDERVALGWYLSAAQQGHAKATMALGKFFAESHTQLAHTQFETAAQAGNAEAQYSWAQTLGKKAVTLEEQETVVHWLALAAKQGHAKAQVMLGRAYATGRGVVRDLEQAREWFRVAVHSNTPLAHVALAELDEQGGRRSRAHQRSRVNERREASEKWELQQTSLDPEETFALGTMYEKGFGVAMDLQRASKLYQIAAEAGDTQAQCALARLLAVDQRFEAIQWAERAAEAGNADGMLLAGTLRLEDLKQGKGGALAAADWCSRAAMLKNAHGASYLLEIMKKHAQELEAECLFQQALAGDVQAQMDYGVCLESGHGVTQNSSEARRWIGLAAEAGYAKAQVHRALAILDSKVGGDYMAQAANWLEKAALQDDYLAQWHLGGLFTKGGFGLEQDLKQAFHWCRLAAQGGFVPAQATLGYLYSRIGDHSAAGIWLEKAAQAGDAEAQFNFALHLTHSDETSLTHETAADWLMAAADKGLSVAQSELGLRYSKGQGLLLDPVEAHKWFILAAERGEPAAIKNLKLSASGLSPLQQKESRKRAEIWSCQHGI